MSITREEGAVRIVVRPSERALRAVALFGLASVWLWHLLRLFSHDALHQKQDMAAVTMWLLPLCALGAYNVWAFFGRQEIVADVKDLCISSCVGRWDISSIRFSRASVDSIEFVDVSKRVRGHTYRSRRVIFRGGGEILGRTLLLDSSETGQRIVQELIR